MLRRKKAKEKSPSKSKMGSHSQHGNSQSRIEIRGVETIEEFFRPEFAQNTQSLDDINDDSDDDAKGSPNRSSKLKK